MRQILQHLGSGQTELAVVPAPGPATGQVLILATQSLVSLGTERMLVEFGRAGWLSKARQQPEKLRQVWRKVRAEGLWSTWSAIRGKLAQPIPMGYCHVGRVVAAPTRPDLAVGDRVVSNGPHAEVVSVADGLVERIPDNVSDEDAAFAPLAAIALQGLRLMAVRAGDRVVVSGLGLIGQLAVRILIAQGCEVFGLDPDADKCLAAERFGARTFVVHSLADPVPSVLAWTQGQGVAGVLITASTPSSDPVNQAARCCRRHGKVVLVGVVGLQLDRADFYRQEVTFQVSRSYGSADPADPFAAQRNFRDVLALMSEGRLSTEGLVSGRLEFGRATQAYDAIHRGGTLGLLLAYGSAEGLLARELELVSRARPSGGLPIAVIGAGNFVARTLVPALLAQASRPSVAHVVSARGANALVVARQAGAGRVSTDAAAALADPSVRAVFIATRHHHHAAQALAALRAGKAVWVEKPLALAEPDLAAVAEAQAESGAVFMVGFNRRFAPLAQHVAHRLRAIPGPKRFEATINAGSLPADHWTLDPTRGGGRIVGEACHFVDLFRFWAAAPIVSVHAVNRGADGQDGGRFVLEFADGSTGHLHYLTDLDPTAAKERFTIAGEGWEVEIDNWTRCRGRGISGFDRGGFWKSTPDKGHRWAVQAFLEAVRTRAPSPIPFDEILEVSRWSIRMQALRLP
jgi:predicted dehydrogenase/threonine dehydrogenase-like Zn-dependent dehydrogenase